MQHCCWLLSGITKVQMKIKALSATAIGSIAEEEDN